MGQISLATALLIGIGTSCAFAQAPAEAAVSKSVEATQPSAADTNEVPPPSQGNTQSVFAGSLNGSGLFALGDEGDGLIASMTAGGGWDSNPSNSSHTVTSSLYSLSPYIAVHGAFPKMQLILQYQPTLIGYTGSYETQVVHAMSAQGAGKLNERIDWKVNANASYGANSSRFLAPEPSVPIGNVPGTGTSSASFLPSSNQATYILGSIETNYRRSERGTFMLNLWNSFNSVGDFDQSGGVATVRTAYSHETLPTLTLMVFGQMSQYYGGLKCQGFGGGAGLRWQPSENTAMTAEAGPQINTSKCGSQQGYTFSFGYSARLSRNAQLYLMANRLPMVSYLGPGIWQSGASGGMQYQVSRAATARVDFGYASSSSLTTVNSYRGTSFSASYDVLLGRGFALSYSYRGYFTNSGGTGYSRNLALVSLTWRNNAGKLFQTY